MHKLPRLNAHARRPHWHPRLSIQPHAVYAEGPGGHNVMMPTARYMNPVGGRDARQLREEVKMGQRRLVVSHTLCGHNQLERVPKTSLGLLKQIVVTIGQHRQPAMHRPQTRQHLLDVRKKRQRTPRLPQFARFSFGEIDPYVVAARVSATTRISL
jgi:hypothetical protein